MKEFQDKKKNVQKHNEVLNKSIAVLEKDIEALKRDIKALSKEIEVAKVKGETTPCWLLQSSVCVRYNLDQCLK